MVVSADARCSSDSPLSDVCNCPATLSSPTKLPVLSKKLRPRSSIAVWASADDGTKRCNMVLNDVPASEPANPR